MAVEHRFYTDYDRLGTRPFSRGPLFDGPATRLAHWVGIVFTVYRLVL